MYVYMYVIFRRVRKNEMGVCLVRERKEVVRVARVRACVLKSRSWGFFAVCEKAGDSW